MAGGASRVCPVLASSNGQGEALWKAMGNAARRPKAGELRLSHSALRLAELCGRGLVRPHSRQRDAVWSLASQNIEPLTLHPC